MRPRPALGRRDAKGRRPRGLSLARVFRLTAIDRGQTSVEHIGMIVLVVAIIGALVGTGVTTELGQTITTKICRSIGASCGTASGDTGSPQAGGTGGTSGGQRSPTKTSDGSNGSPEPKTQAEKDYEKALKDLEAAEGELSAEEKKTVEAAKKLAKILADELGITDAVKCFTEGDPSSCGETAVNVVLSLIGGLPAKILKKYGWPTQWKKGAKVAKELVKHGKDVVKHGKGIWDAKKKVDKLRKKVDDLKKKLPKREKKPDADLPCGKHSFLPGTQVLMADGSRRSIEDVRLGDLVTVTDPKTGLTTDRPVTRTIATGTDQDFTRLTVLDKGSPAALTATDTHPFWSVDQNRWLDAGAIRPGTHLRTSAGDAVQVTDVVRYTWQQRTHDLTVAGIHTYYVGIGSVSALVHNDGCDLTKYRLNLEKRGANYGNPRQRAYQRKHLGNTEYRVEGGGKRVWADGIDSKTGDLLDAKFVDNPARSPFIKDSEAPDFIRKKVDSEIDDEMSRYAAVVKDQSTPHKAMHILVNDERAVEYFEEKLRKHGIPGTVEVKP